MNLFNLLFPKMYFSMAEGGGAESDAALAKREETAIGRPAPRRGFEEPTEQEDLILPRVLMIQYTPPKTVEIDPKIHVPGSLINSLTKEILPLDEAGGVVFVPILKKKNWVRFNPSKKDDKNFDPAFEPGAVIWRSDNPLDPRVKAGSEFGPNGEPPAVTAFLNFLAYIPGYKMPIIVSFSKTSYRAGKELLSLTQFSDGDMFAWKYRLKAKAEKNDLGQFFVLKVEKIGANEGDEFKKCESLWNDFHAREFKTHGEESPEEGAEAAKDGNKAPW